MSNPCREGLSFFRILVLVHFHHLLLAKMRWSVKLPEKNEYTNRDSHLMDDADEGDDDNDDLQHSTAPVEKITKKSGKINKNCARCKVPTH